MEDTRKEERLKWTLIAVCGAMVTCGLLMAWTDLAETHITLAISAYMFSIYYLAEKKYGVKPYRKRDRRLWEDYARDYKPKPNSAAKFMLYLVGSIISYAILLFAAGAILGAKNVPGIVAILLAIPAIAAFFWTLPKVAPIKKEKRLIYTEKIIK